jgi:hypothetical protein
MELVANSGLTGLGVLAFLLVVMLSGLVIVPALEWLANR